MSCRTRFLCAIGPPLRSGRASAQAKPSMYLDVVSDIRFSEVKATT